MSKGIPKCFWPTVFLEAWGTKAPKPHIFKKRLFLLALPHSAARPKNNWFPENVRFVALVPHRPPKDHLAKKPLRDPFGQCQSTWSAPEVRNPRSLGQACDRSAQNNSKWGHVCHTALSEHERVTVSSMRCKSKLPQTTQTPLKRLFGCMAQRC